MFNRYLIKKEKKVFQNTVYFQLLEPNISAQLNINAEFNQTYTLVENTYINSIQ